MLSKHFKRSEFKCRCGKCRSIAVDYELVIVLEDIRRHFNSPIRITSAYRCDEHNREVGGAFNSMHLTGKACDIVVKNVEPSVVQRYLINTYKDSYGIGCYDKFTHIDVRDNKARW